MKPSCFTYNCEFSDNLNLLSLKVPKIQRIAQAVIYLLHYLHSLNAFSVFFSALGLLKIITSEARLIFVLLQRLTFILNDYKGRSQKAIAIDYMQKVLLVAIIAFL